MSKKPAVVVEQPTIIDTSYDSVADIIDVEEEITVESPLPKGKAGATTEMSAAEKLKSQTQNISPLKNATPSTSKNTKKKRQRRDSGTSSEEERWLDAIESGKLEQVDDELKKIKDPKLMTARQRAMYDRNMDNNKETSPGGEALMALPSGYKEKVMTAEAIQKAALKSQKRKQLADEKREKDKKKTMERLLKKQETKTTKNNKKIVPKVTVPMITYVDSVKNGTLIRFPPNVDFPIQPQTSREPPKPILCAICNAVKRYNCSRTNIPLCSFKCYKVNVESVKQIIC